MKSIVIPPRNPEKRDRDVLRDELAEDVAAFERSGGKVDRLPDIAGDAGHTPKGRARVHRRRPGAE